MTFGQEGRNGVMKETKKPAAVINSYWRKLDSAHQGARVGGT
jgi:hypothetical protein